MTKLTRNTRNVWTLALFVGAILFSAAVATAFSNMAAFAQSSNGDVFKGNVSAAIGSDQVKGKGNVNATANIGGNASTHSNASASYKPSYPKEQADENRPFIVHTEKHLYKPGEEVTIEGSILTSLMNQIGGNVSSVMLNVTDNKGNSTVGQKEAQVNDNGTFTTSFTLPQNAELGSYSIDATIKVKASVLDTLSVDVKSKLNTSARFEVISSNAFAVKAEDGKSFDVDIASNSTVKQVEFKQQEKKISFHVEGQTGTKGVTDITVPKALLSGQITVSIDGKVIPPESGDVVTIADTEDGMTLEINYHHSEHTIEVSGTSVVPEFPLPVVGAIAAVIGIVAVIGRTTLMVPRK